MGCHVVGKGRFQFSGIRAVKKVIQRRKGVCYRCQGSGHVTWFGREMLQLGVVRCGEGRVLLEVHLPIILMDVRQCEIYVDCRLYKVRYERGKPVSGRF